MPQAWNLHFTHSFIHIVYPIFTAYTFALRYWNRTGRCQSTPSAAPERPRYKFSQQKRKTTTQKNARKKEGEREKKVFVFLLSVLFRRTKIIKLALCKTRQKLFKLDNCAAGTVVVVRHCCSGTDRKNLWHHDDNNDDDDITNNYIVTSPTPTWFAQRQLRDSVYSKWYY